MDEKKDAATVDDEQEEQMTHEEPEVEIIDTEDDDTSLDESSEESGLIHQLKTDNEKLEQEKDDYYHKMVRVQAEYDNFKKRTQKEKQADRKYRAQDVVTELLSVIDNFERALQVEVTKETESFVEGMRMIYNQINTVIEEQGVEKIDTVGEEFDPTVHHAVMQVEDEEKESNIVVEELQTGYRLHDRVIRPAMVKVNK